MEKVLDKFYISDYYLVSASYDINILWIKDDAPLANQEQYYHSIWSSLDLSNKTSPDIAYVSSLDPREVHLQWKHLIQSLHAWFEGRRLWIYQID